MSQVLPTPSLEANTALAALYENSAPLLVEVRFPKMTTSPDWYLLGEKGELDPILDSLGPGVEIYLHSVWDLKNRREPVCLKK